MNPIKTTVLITGCSEGGMGAALAKEFHSSGYNVYATARDQSKMTSLSSLGIKTMTLDIQSQSSIDHCVESIPHLDILVNNAGASYTMPIVDLSIAEAKKLFDCNVWGHLALTQAFMPRLLASKKAMVVNHTSVGVHAALPFQAAYNASKAAMAMFSDILRLELQPFDITVVNLKTAGVKTNIVQNIRARQPQLPASSIYSPAKELVESALRSEWVGDRSVTAAEQWAKEVVADLQRSTVPPVIWRGGSAWLARFASALPFGWLDGTYKKMTGLEKIEQTIRGRQRH
jgi:NADP-dependent 3-hydroxy acid dehydrogenase YdfG